MKNYTIVGLWDDSNEPLVEYANADSPEAAIAVLIDELEADGESTSSLIIISAFEGRHEDKLKSDAAFYAEDAPSSEEGEAHVCDDDCRSYGCKEKGFKSADGEEG